MKPFMQTLIVCKQMVSEWFKNNVIDKLFTYKSYNIYIYKYLALNNVLRTN